VFWIALKEQVFFG